jgi:hypothetical protein
MNFDLRVTFYRSLSYKRVCMIFILLNGKVSTYHLTKFRILFSFSIWYDRQIIQQIIMHYATIRDITLAQS